MIRPADFPVSIDKNGLDRCIRFLNESNRIETIKEIDYKDNQYRDPAKGHFGAFILSQQAAQERKQLTAKDLKQWQGMLTREQLLFNHHIEENEIGRTRGPALQKNVRIGSHIPPSWEHVPLKLMNLIEDINEELKDPEKLNDDAEYCKFLGSVFQRFMAIHPFADGNGRTGRLLANYIATYCKRPIIVFNSEMIERNRYYEAHKSKRDMCLFMAKKIQEAIFSTEGTILLASNKLSGSTTEYSSPTNDLKESYEWHKLEREWGESVRDALKYKGEEKKNSQSR